jgi:hypothetical protein
MSKYRIKTEEEFLEQYGWIPNWNFPNMNYLFGQPLTKEQCQKIEEGKDIRISTQNRGEDSCWWIEKQHIVKTK